MLNDRMSDYFDLIGPYLNPSLISRDSFAAIQAIACQLPGAITHVFGVECRLGPGTHNADFLFCVHKLEREALAGLRTDVNLPVRFWSEPVWQRIRDFCIKWSSPGSNFYENIEDIWLEFDVGETIKPNPIPSLFFGTKAFQSKSQQSLAENDWLFGALAELMGKELPLSVKSQVRECIQFLPQDAKIFEIGMFLARYHPWIRLCIEGIEANQVVNYLKVLKYPYELAPLEGWLKDLRSMIERPILDIDVGDGLGPKVGFECKIDRSNFLKHKSRIFRLLDYIVEKGWCTPEKREALLSYPGVMDERQISAICPGVLPSGLRKSHSECLSVLQRDISHIKLVYCPGSEIEAKLYLGAFHFLLSPLEAAKMALAFSPGR